MIDPFDARLWEMAEGPWVPLKGLLVRAWEASGVHPNNFSLKLMTAIQSGELEIRVPNNSSGGFSHIMSKRHAEIYAKVGWFEKIDWNKGTLKEPLLTIEVYWPGVLALIQPAPAGDAQKRKPAGRPPKHSWGPILEKLAEHFRENGLPSDRNGEQADIERLVASWFPPDHQPAESLIRDRVRQSIASYRTFLAESR